MTDHEAAAAAVLAEFQPIGEDVPQMQAFEQAVAEHVAVRPSPSPPAPADPVVTALQMVSGQLTTIIHQNAAIIDILGKGATP